MKSLFFIMDSMVCPKTTISRYWPFRTSQCFLITQSSAPAGWREKIWTQDCPKACSRDSQKRQIDRLSHRSSYCLAISHLPLSPASSRLSLPSPTCTLHTAHTAQSSFSLHALLVKITSTYPYLPEADPSLMSCLPDGPEAGWSVARPCSCWECWGCQERCPCPPCSSRPAGHKSWETAFIFPFSHFCPIDFSISDSYRTIGSPM